MNRSLIILLTVIIFIGCTQTKKDEIGDQIYRDQIIKISKRLYDRGLYWGTGGDISVRIPGTDRFIIKATGQCLGDLNDDKLSTVTLSNELLSGPQPSHETDIHTDIYKIREDVGAILHMHSPYATAWGCVGKPIPPLTQQSVTLLKDTGLVPYFPVGSETLVDAVVECYHNPSTQVVLMENHGTFVVAKDLYNLLYDAEKVENTAKIACLCKALGKPRSFKAEVIY